MRRSRSRLSSEARNSTERTKLDRTILPSCGEAFGVEEVFCGVRATSSLKNNSLVTTDNLPMRSVLEAAHLLVFVGVAKRVHQFPELCQAQDPVLVPVSQHEQPLRKLLNGRMGGL